MCACAAEGYLVWNPNGQMIYNAIGYSGTNAMPDILFPFDHISIEIYSTLVTHQSEYI